MQTDTKTKLGRPPSELCLKPGDWKADHLRRLRQDRELTMEQLAEAVRVTRRMIHLAEKGNSLSPRLANALIAYFKLPTSEIIIGDKQIFLVENAISP
jgi:DNA-binding XRE family transcriptional regulator